MGIQLELLKAAVESGAEAISGRYLGKKVGFLLPRQDRCLGSLYEGVESVHRRLQLS